MADVSIKYHDAEIAALSATGSKILTTGGMFCDDDITVDYDVPASAHVFYTTATATTNIRFSIPNGQSSGYTLMVLTINPDDVTNEGISYYLFDLVNDCGYVSSVSSDSSLLTRLVQNVLGSTSNYGVRWDDNDTLVVVRAAANRSFTIGSRYKVAFYK